MEQTKSGQLILDIWNSVSQKVSVDNFKIDITKYRKLFKFFEVGPSYYMIFNISKVDLEFVSATAPSILGYDLEEFTMPFYVSLIHPEDQKWYANAEKTTGNFLYSLPPEKIPNYKVQYDLRFRRKDGRYIRILLQIVTVQQYPDGGIYKTLALNTDITHLKPTGSPVLSFIGLEGEPSYMNVKPEEILIPYKPELSVRELQILELIVEGKANKQIADELKLSKLTVDKHRKNMIAKAGCKNAVELVGVAFKKGWLS